MNIRTIFAFYITLWVAVASGVIYGIVVIGTSAGLALRYSVGLGWIVVALLFLFVNGSVAYRFRSRLLRLEGKTPPPYLQYIFFRKGFDNFKKELSPKNLKNEAPRSLQIIVGILTAITGMFFVGCGVALALDAEYSHIQHPIQAILSFMPIASIGCALLYLAWKMMARRNRKYARTE